MLQRCTVVSFIFMFSNIPKGSNDMTDHLKMCLHNGLLFLDSDMKNEKLYTERFTWFCFVQTHIFEKNQIFYLQIIPITIFKVLMKTCTSDNLI